MTESTHKKSKDGRYHGKSNDEIIEPLTNLDDDEDAIDRLLINTGFDGKEDFLTPGTERDDTFEVYADLAPEADAFCDDEGLSATRPTRPDDDIVPVEIGSPIADIAPIHYQTAFPSSASPQDPAAAEKDRFWTPEDDAAEFGEAILAHFIRPNDVDESIEPVDLASPLADIDPTEAPVMNSTPPAYPGELFERQPAASIKLEAEPNPIGSGYLDDDAPLTAHPETTAKNGDNAPTARDAAALEKDLSPAITEFPTDWDRLLSLQEDTQQQLMRLEEKARKTGRLACAAFGLSVIALCAALAAGYLNVRTGTEQTRLKELQAVLEENINGLSEELDGYKHAAEDNAEVPSRLADESSAKPEDTQPTIDAQLPAPESIQTVVKPEPAIAGKSASAPVQRKTPARHRKPALKTASHKPAVKPTANETSAHWMVNLASFRHRQDARKKAAEFRQKGIAVKLTKVNISRSTWYRLSVAGFKTRQAASTQSTRLKKLLHLNSTWVAAI